MAGYTGLIGLEGLVGLERLGTMAKIGRIGNDLKDWKDRLGLTELERLTRIGRIRRMGIDKALDATELYKSLLQRLKSSVERLLSADHQLSLELRSNWTPHHCWIIGAMKVLHNMTCNTIFWTTLFVKIL